MDHDRDKNPSVPRGEAAVKPYYEKINSRSKWHIVLDRHEELFLCGQTRAPTTHKMSTVEKEPLCEDLCTHCYKEYNRIVFLAR